MAATVGAVAALVAASIAATGATFAAAATGSVSPRATGELDCNGYSTIQTSVRPGFVCADLHGANGGRFYDNGWYIGHEEPTIQFLSTAPGTGDNVTWRQQLPLEPTVAPTDNSPANPVTHSFELTVAPWFSMMMCDPNSYLETPCNPQSDTNATSYGGEGGGSAFMEMQFYPPGSPPFINAISCDDTHWCAALTIDSLEATNNFAYINPACTEPVNFGFIERDTAANNDNPAPSGPPSPQLADASTFIPDGGTLLMNPNDQLSVHMYDAQVPGERSGTNAFKVVVDDLTTGQTGSMQASAANGFMNTNYVTCAGTAFNFQPEFNTASSANISPWAALQANINTEFETGHFTPCSSIYRTAGGSGTKEECMGAYETAAGPDNSNPENNSKYIGAHYVSSGNDGFCAVNGQTFPGLGVGGATSDPVTVTGCDDFYNGGDLDYDGTPYYPDWPSGTSATSFPSTMIQQQPVSGSSTYSQLRVETDLAATEYTCNTASYPGLTGCTAPPPGPGNFYPYWSQNTLNSTCVFEFGQVPGNTFSQAGAAPDSQYGTPSSRYFGNLAGPVQSNPCAVSGGGGGGGKKH
ncbi:MAG TPA: hypothetical protein VNG13_07465 [Mycobacteriales bacterium]|nr:hypothetical protein [Mycobacteriales bacterium]